MMAGQYRRSEAIAMRRPMLQMSHDCLQGFHLRRAEEADFHDRRALDDAPAGVIDPAQNLGDADETLVPQHHVGDGTPCDRRESTRYSGELVLVDETVEEGQSFERMRR